MNLHNRCVNIYKKIFIVGDNGMSVLNAVILGLVQGVTEFLPVSSSGHLSFLNNLFNMTTAEDGHLLFDALLHLGTLVSICVVYWKDIVQMVCEILSFANVGPLAGQRQARYPAARLFFMLVIATLPLLFILPVKDYFESLFYRSAFVGVALILTGCVLYVADKMTQGKKAANSMTILDAVIIGICQCVAVIPGLSRSGVTITGGIATGLKRDFAVKFSFLLSIPAVLGANILSLADAARSGIDVSSIPAYLVGTVVAAVSGIASIKLLKYISNKGKFGGFAYYCWVIGVLTVILSLIF